VNKIKLNVLGISYSQTQSGAYALVLTEDNGHRRIPIIVGGFEAQSIAIQLEGLHPPRPLTHDLFLHFAKAFDIKIAEVIIYKLEEGVFYSKLICVKGEERIPIDSRTSDAIALALRFSCSIFTTPEIIEKAGVVIDFDLEKTDDNKAVVPASSSISTDSEFELIDNEELHKMLNEAVSNENYERASLIRDELNRRGK